MLMRMLQPVATYIIIMENMELNSYVKQEDDVEDSEDLKLNTDGELVNSLNQVSRSKEDWDREIKSEDFINLTPDGLLVVPSTDDYQSITAMIFKSTALMTTESPCFLSHNWWLESISILRRRPETLYNSINWWHFGQFRFDGLKQNIILPC